MNAPDRQAWPGIRLADLLARPATAAAADDLNRFLFARIIASQANGIGCLPADLGLGTDGYRRLIDEYFPGFAGGAPGRPVDELPEWSDLHKLLIDHAAGKRPSEPWIAEMVATACAGRDHLWQDLGLAARDELSALMRMNFPELARANTSDMKWKKFLYRQFCSRDGIYICPAPSCGECRDYTKCFGPEN
ncbi:Protein NifQ [Candidatus Accumulibacter aalborgensis]|uniref:Protein NifQ n=1 Tax=Candidatus Accumulibacter aalborgensis TaxID=1860102 RepID=A0A1A8XS04_9PROT|nr:nitrogen fixation protein NifQ [Candidatus Accumulibacter aalborgensis]SBT07899.1 Protein NifQ [Candidatus Accumulibacter aalborgensis]